MWGVRILTDGFNLRDINVDLNCFTLQLQGVPPECTSITSRAHEECGVISPAGGCRAVVESDKESTNLVFGRLRCWAECQIWTRNSFLADP